MLLPGRRPARSANSSAAAWTPSAARDGHRDVGALPGPSWEGQCEKVSVVPLGLLGGGFICMPSTGAAVRKHRAGFPGGAVSAPYTSLAQLEYTSISFWKPLVLGTSNKSVFLHLVSLKLLKNQANVTSVFLVLSTRKDVQ